MQVACTWTYRVCNQHHCGVLQQPALANDPAEDVAPNEAVHGRQGVIQQHNVRASVHRTGQ